MKTIFLIALLFPFAALAADYTLVIKDHRFEPAELIVPSGVKFKLVIDNQDATPCVLCSKPTTYNASKAPPAMLANPPSKMLQIHHPIKN